MFNKDIPQASCICEICKNLILLAKSMCPILNLLIQTNIHILVESYSCDSSSKSCMYSACDKCCDTRLKVEGFKDVCTEIQYYQLKRVDKKSSKSRIYFAARQLNNIVWRRSESLPESYFHKTTITCCTQSLERKLKAWRNFAAPWLQWKSCEQTTRWNSKHILQSRQFFYLHDLLLSSRCWRETGQWKCHSYFWSKRPFGNRHIFLCK